MHTYYARTYLHEVIKDFRGRIKLREQVLAEDHLQGKKVSLRQLITAEGGEESETMCKDKDYTGEWRPNCWGRQSVGE